MAGKIKASYPLAHLSEWLADTQYVDLRLNYFGAFFPHPYWASEVLFNKEFHGKKSIIKRLEEVSLLRQHLSSFIRECRQTTRLVISNYNEIMSELIKRHHLPKTHVIFGEYTDLVQYSPNFNDDFLKLLHEGDIKSCELNDYQKYLPIVNLAGYQLLIEINRLLYDFIIEITAAYYSKEDLESLYYFIQTNDNDSLLNWGEDYQYILIDYVCQRFLQEGNYGPLDKLRDQASEEGIYPFRFSSPKIDNPAALALLQYPRDYELLGRVGIVHFQFSSDGNEIVFPNLNNHKLNQNDKEFQAYVFGWHQHFNLLSVAEIGQLFMSFSNPADLRQLIQHIERLPVYFMIPEFKVHMVKHDLSKLYKNFENIHVLEAEATKNSRIRQQLIMFPPVAEEQSGCSHGLIEDLYTGFETV